jgi:hypothetical protein
MRKVVLLKRANFSIAQKSSFTRQSATKGNFSQGLRSFAPLLGLDFGRSGHKKQPVPTAMSSLSAAYRTTF